MRVTDPFSDANVRLLGDLSRCVRLVTSVAERPAPTSDSRAAQRLREGRARREAIRKASLRRLEALSIQLECAVETQDVLWAAQCRDEMQAVVEGLKSFGGAL